MLDCCSRSLFILQEPTILLNATAPPLSAVVQIMPLTLMCFLYRCVGHDYVYVTMTSHPYRCIGHDYVVHVYDVTSVRLTRYAILTSLLPALKHFMLIIIIIIIIIIITVLLELRAVHYTRKITITVSDSGTGKVELRDSTFCLHLLSVYIFHT
jgi:hypothetical protein